METESALIVLTPHNLHIISGFRVRLLHPDGRRSTQSGKQEQAQVPVRDLSGGRGSSGTGSGSVSGNERIVVEWVPAIPAAEIAKSEAIRAVYAENGIVGNVIGDSVPLSIPQVGLSRAVSDGVMGGSGDSGGSLHQRAVAAGDAAFSAAVVGLWNPLSPQSSSMYSTYSTTAPTSSTVNYEHHHLTSSVESGQRNRSSPSFTHPLPTTGGGNNVSNDGKYGSTSGSGDKNSSPYNAHHTASSSKAIPLSQKDWLKGIWAELLSSDLGYHCMPLNEVL